MAATHTTLRWTPLGYAQISTLSSAVGFAAASVNIPTGTVMVVIAAEAKDVRWRDDGVAPTAGVGMPLPAGQQMQYTVPDFSLIQFIEQAASAKLNLAFYM